MNKVVLIGRLVKDTTLNFIPSSGTAMQKFTIAVDKRKKEEGADFLNCVWFGKGAEATANYMSKGKQVAVSGRIQTGNYVNKEGNKVYTTDIMVEDLKLLGSKNDNFGNSLMEKSSYDENMQESVDDGDIPF
jgi:single-strand DNA-binding protein